jgi:uracil-DNA glycosylase
MNVNLASDWKKLLESEFEKKYFQDLADFVRTAYRSTTCYPKGSEIFSAFEACPLNQLKVIILGQDPYHGEGQANGLAFSVNDGVAFPLSLTNIFKEIEADIHCNLPSSGNLMRWAQQGVLLLNATLTVEAQKAGSHQKKGWETFTDAVIQKLSTEKEGLIFLLWGGYAKKKIKLIDTSKHHVLTTGHPSPLSANRGYWFGNRHFSQTNELLQQQQKTPIVW